jgi:hypothetical protein
VPTAGAADLAPGEPVAVTVTDGKDGEVKLTGALIFTFSGSIADKAGVSGSCRGTRGSPAPEAESCRHIAGTKKPRLDRSRE